MRQSDMRRHTMVRLLFMVGLVIPAAAALTAGDAAAADKIPVKVHNASEVMRGLQLIDQVCERKVFNGKLKPDQTKTFRVCADGDGLATVITVNWAGCSSSVRETHEGLAAGSVVTIPDPGEAAEVTTR